MLYLRLLFLDASTLRFAFICGPDLMKMLKYIISSAFIFGISLPAYAGWTWVSDDLLVTEGISRYADRLEIMQTSDCWGVRMRAWAKVADKTGNALKRGDFFELDVRLGDVQMLGQTKVLNVVYDFDKDFDVIYLDFGEWQWGIADILAEMSDHSLTATFLTDKADIDDNLWNLNGLAQEVAHLRLKCRNKSKGLAI